MIPTHWLIMILVSFLFVPYATADDQASQVNVVRVLPALDIQRLQYVLTHDRKQVFEEGMILEARQKKLFWGVYHRFEKEKEQLDAKRLRLLGTYIEKFPTLTNDEALKIMKQSGQNQRAELELRQKYFKILSKKISPVVAARFAQLDDIVGMTIRLAILGNVPLIGGPAVWNRQANSRRLLKLPRKKENRNKSSPTSHITEDTMQLKQAVVVALSMTFIASEIAVGLDIFVYPDKGQTKEQQERDEFACYKWAKEQTGVDPESVWLPESQDGGRRNSSNKPLNSKPPSSMRRA